LRRSLHAGQRSDEATRPSGPPPSIIAKPSQNEKASPTHLSGGDKNHTQYENQQGEDVTEFAHTQAILKSQKP
jgi:hypothetical protein